MIDSPSNYLTSPIITVSVFTFCWIIAKINFFMFSLFYTKKESELFSIWRKHKQQQQHCYFFEDQKVPTLYRTSNPINIFLIKTRRETNLRKISFICGLSAKLQIFKLILFLTVQELKNSSKRVVNVQVGGCFFQLN